jgi:hypothetical protein
LFSVSWGSAALVIPLTGHPTASAALHLNSNSVDAHTAPYVTHGTPIHALTLHPRPRTPLFPAPRTHAAASAMFLAGSFHLTSLRNLSDRAELKWIIDVNEETLQKTLQPLLANGVKGKSCRDVSFPRLEEAVGCGTRVLWQRITHMSTGSTNLSDALEDDSVDAVIIASTTHAHYEVGITQLSWRSWPRRHCEFSTHVRASRSW